jgi:glycosyltransferase involved in cell wall biosynthesis
VILSIANELSASHQVDLVLVRAEGIYLSDVAVGVRLIDLDATRVAASLFPLVRYLRSHRPDVVFSTLSHANVVAVAARSLIRRRPRPRLVVSEHSHLSSSTSLAPERRARLLPHLMRLAYPRADAIVAVSDGVAQDLSQGIGVPRDAIEVIHNPIASYPAAGTSLDREHQWLASGQPPVILAAGRLAQEKDFPTLIGAFAELRKRRNVRLIILGEGALRPELERLTVRLGVADAVAMPGFVSAPQAYMAEASVFVLSSIHEGFGNVLAEAMACGTPVVSTDCPSGPSEILEGGRWGRLVPIGDVTALATAIGASLDDPNPPPVRERAADFALDRVLPAYKRVLGIRSGTGCAG